ncbi:MAG TPA: choice-of-anchor Q domain-containing protein [Xanthomonadales bacterium]|nr:choice-of-anchor Q domain-containing protein [Xanthomonadales bacterium]
MFKISTLLVGMLWISINHAATFTVGTGGTYDNIQAAINQALMSSGSDEIRVGSGTYVENLNYFPTGSGKVLTISGGWNSLFDSQGDIPSVVDGDMTGPVLYVDIDSGDVLILDNLKFQNGLANSGGGLDISLIDDSSLMISDCEIENNTAQNDRTTSGGMDVYAEDDASFTMVDSRIVGNQVICTGSVDCRAGGISLTGFGNTQVTFNRNEILNNSVTIGSGSAATGGAEFIIAGTSVLTIEDNHFIGNSISGTTPFNGIGLSMSGSGTITARRNYVEANNASVPSPQFATQLDISVSGDSSSILSDSVVVNSGTLGVRAGISGDGNPTLYLVNLTIADHMGAGIRLSKFSAGGQINLSNSISVNGNPNAEITAGTTESDNLLTGSAGFVNAAAGNYRLAVGSPAINAGNNAPLGGLGPTDIEGNPRIFNVTVDQGAYESQSMAFFADGFED